MKHLVFIFLLLFSMSAIAQTGIGTTNPDPSAKLEVSSTSKGFLVPRMNKNQRDSIPNPAEGLIIFQTDSETGLYVYATGEWIKADLNDITKGTAIGEMKYWDGTAWIIIPPGTLGQVLTFSDGVPTWK